MSIELISWFLIFRDYVAREKSRAAYSQCARGRRWTRWTWTHCASVRTATTVRGTTGRRASSPARVTRRRPSAPTVATACPRDPRWPPGDPDGATLRDSLQPQRTWPSTNGPPCDCHSLRCKTLPFFPRGWALTASLIIIVNIFVRKIIDWLCRKVCETVERFFCCWLRRDDFSYLVTQKVVAFFREKLKSFLINCIILSTPVQTVYVHIACPSVYVACSVTMHKCVCVCWD